MAQAAKKNAKEASERRLQRELACHKPLLVPEDRNMTKELTRMLGRRASEIAAFEKYREQYGLDQFATVTEVLACRTITLAMSGRSDSALRQIWERVEGKVADSVNMNHRGVVGVAAMNLSNMTDDQLGRIRSVLDKGGNVLDAAKEAEELPSPKLLEGKAG